MIAFLVYLSIMTGIYGILSLSLNLQYGFTGLANFGHVAFFCLGAYTSTILVVLVKAPFIVGLLGGILAAGIFGLLISIPTANLKEDYWAIVTLAAAEIIRLFFLNEDWIFGRGPYHGGAFGIGGIPRPLQSWFSATTYPFFYLCIVVFCLAFTYLTVTLVTNSPLGRVLKAMREGDDLPLAVGKDVSKFKMKVMALGGAMGGLAGVLLAHFWSFIDPYQFMPIETFIVWAMVVVGGKGNHLGAIVGAVVIQLFYSSTQFLKDYIPIDAQVLASLRMVVIGVLIVLVMLFMKEGLVKEKKKIYHR
ncbi:MAG: branched-chain amino acid ABC transporter permease [Proteobacteria bacterium]|nr:branched-chain amino acid ABC transporter permease [Pseudomonadota bacterium]